MSGFGFIVLGVPAPQGSKRAFVVNGRAIITEDSKRTKPWRQAIIDAAPVMEPLDGPLAFYAVFTMPKPQKVPKGRTRPSTKPDLSKLVRAAEDSCKDAGLIVDDARIAEYARVAKVWAFHDEDALRVPGAILGACEIVSGEDFQIELNAIVESTLQEYNGKLTVVG